MANIPKKINPAWLRQRRTVLDCTLKLLDGEPNPSYVKLAEEIAEAEAALARRDVFEAWVKAELGASLNQYPLRTANGVLDPGQAFVKKDMTTGKTSCWTIQQAWNKFEAK